MKRTFCLICLLAGLNCALAQNYHVREDVLSDISKTAGMEMPYRFDNGIPTPAPKGYKPFYISHYGRHGSRYAWSTKFYTVPLEVFTDAHNEGLLTPRGEQFYADFIDFYKVPLINYGDLVPKGWDQHERIAQIMYDSFPEVLKGEKKVEAIVSTSPRAIVSMSSFCLGLKEKNPKLDIYQSSTHTGLAVVTPSSAPAELREEHTGFKPEEIERFESREEFGKRTGNYDVICARLFKDPDFPDRYEGGKHEFILHLFGLVCGYHNYEDRPLFDDIFTAEEMERIWEVNNYSSFLYDIHNRWLNVPLLRDIIEKADKAISGENTNAADLRFGHDYVLEAFNALINTDGCGTIPETSDDVKYWVQSYNISHAANDQFIFYKSRKGGDVLFKLLLNGREASLPQLTPVSGPYYRWSDFKAWAHEMLLQHPVVE